MNEKIADLIMAAESNDDDAQGALYECIDNRELSESGREQIHDWLLRSAKLGNAMSMYGLGRCYEGKGSAETDKMAFDWFVESAKAGYSVAFEIVGVCYKEGNGVAKDYAKAIDFFEKAIETEGWDGVIPGELGGDLGEVHSDDLAWWEAVAVRSVRYPVVPFCVGNYYYMLKDPDLLQAIRFYKMAAEQGHGRAQYVLGKFYFTGEGVEKDPAMALHWLEKAAQQDVQPAMYYLGKLYADDQSAVFDMKKAIYWLKRNAASGDDGEAQGLVELELSWCFTLWSGVDEIAQDESQEESPDTYVDRATYYLSWVEPNLQTESDIAVDEDSWWYRYVKKGDAHALYWLGMCYQHIKQLVPPRGGNKDVCMLDCFRKAAEMGHFGAQHFLGCYFYYGPIRVRDQKEGIRWYRLAAAQGYPDAIEKLEEIKAMDKEP